jgi:excinuclease UvrABC nuclease subunit
LAEDLLSQKLENLPAGPGCYVFLDEGGATLYVGKAKSLRSRVRSYFQAAGSDTRAFLPLLRKNVKDLETIVTASEKEAAILENSLIKERKPRYNIKLRDDKEYLSIRLSNEHAWPRLELVRKPKPDGARYFGPYHSATSARRTLHLVEKHWKLRSCSDRELASRKRPCLKYQIGRCPAPCVYDVDPLVLDDDRAACLGHADLQWRAVNRDHARSARGPEADEEGSWRREGVEVGVIESSAPVQEHVEEAPGDALGADRHLELCAVVE